MTLATDLDQLAIDTIRTLSIDGVQKANSGPSGRADGRRADGLRAVDALPAPRPDATRTGRIATGSSCRAGHASMLLYSLLHLTGYDVSLDDLKSFRQWGSHHAGPPGVRPDAGRRGDDRAARPGLRERGRHGHRRAAARRTSSTGPGTHDRRPPDVRHRLRRRPPGGHRVRGGAASPATCGSGKLVVLYDDNRIQLDGPTAMAWSEDVAEALRRLRLAHPARRRRQRPRRDRGGDRGGPRRRPAEPHRRADPHRLRQPEQAGQPEGARRAARPRRGPPDQGGLRLGPGRDVLRPRRGAATASARPSPAGEALVAEWEARFDAYARRPSRPRPPSSGAG